jgi:L-gulonate 5-dehydrogenase
MYPRVHGHELSGIVEEASGPGLLKSGDRVVVEPLLNCDTCYPCQHGKYNCCANLKVIGAHVDGGFAEFLSVPVNRLHKIPDHIPFDLAAICEPYTIGHHCTSRAPIQPGEYVLILGSGAIGLTAIDFASMKGGRVVVAEVSAYRREMARKFGAEVVIDPSTQNLQEELMSLTNGEGAGIVIEATGVTRVMESTEDLVAAGGTIVIAGLTSDKVAFTGINFTRREMNILGTRNSAHEFPSVIEAIAQGKTHAGLFITRKFPFADFPEAIKYTAENIANEGKVVIEF